MDIQITQPKLSGALNILSRVATSRSALPILANVLVKTKDSNLYLSATNLEVAITHRTPCKVAKDGAVTVPARLAHDFVSSLPKDETIRLLFDKSKLMISAGGYKSSIQGASASDFPALPELGNGQAIKVPVNELKNVLSKVVVAASHDETRPVLGGVLFHINKGELFMASTDGYRLAEVKLMEVAQDELEAIVPLSTLQDVQKIIQDSDEDTIQMQFSEGQFGITTSDTTLVSRLIDGEYPRYQQLIPSQSDIEVEVERDALLTAAKLAGLFARESGGSITLSASSSDNTLAVNSVASQVGDNSSVIKAKVQGDGQVVLNVRYLLEALNTFEGQTINFRFSGSIAPCVLSSPEDPGYQHIVMPLKS